MHGIILAQIDQIDQATVTDFQLTIGLYIKIWRKMFEMVKGLKMRRPLTPKILMDPNHKFV